MGALTMLLSMIKSAQKELDRADLTVDYLVAYAVEHGFLAPSSEDRSEEEITRLIEWLHAYVELQHADLPRLFRAISDRMGWARISADASGWETYYDALLNLDLVGVARERLVALIRKETQAEESAANASTR